MPLYEYQCRSCQHQFELLVRRGDTPACPACRSEELERSISSFAVTTPGVSQARLRKARKDYANSQKDRLIAEKEERDHHHH
jgi:putative FmdB family regulatory protein